MVGTVGLKRRKPGAKASNKGKTKRDDKARCLNVTDTAGLRKDTSQGPTPADQEAAQGPTPADQEAASAFFFFERSHRYRLQKVKHAIQIIRAELVYSVPPGNRHP